MIATMGHKTHAEIDAARATVHKDLDSHRAGDRHYLPQDCGVCRIAAETLALLDKQQLALAENWNGA